MEMAKNIDPDKLQDGITSIQKAISLFGDMITKIIHLLLVHTPQDQYIRSLMTNDY